MKKWISLKRHGLVVGSLCLKKVLRLIAFATGFFALTTYQIAFADTSVGQGWNLLGNGMTNPISISTSSALTNANQVASVWKWNASTRRWAFYTPQISDGGVAYAAAKGFDALTSINAGEGFWVNAAQPFTLPTSTGSLYLSSLLQPNKSGALLLGWNLVSVGNTISPKQLNMDLSLNPPPPGTVPENIVSIWSWDNAQAKWYFYAPTLDGQGGTILKDYAATKGYLDYATSGKNLTLGNGFWVSNPTNPVSSTGSTSTVSSTTTTTQWQPISVTQITGTAALGAAISDKNVEIRCVNASNTAGSVTTTAATDYLGSYTAYISNAAYPCMLRVQNPDDGTYIHSFLEQGNIANITPHTELIAANVLSASPTVVFDYFDQVRNKITTANIQQGISALVTATANITGAEVSSVINPLKNTFKAGKEDRAGDSYDTKLDALMLAIANAELKFSDVVANFASGSLGSVTFSASSLGSAAKASSTCPYARNGKYYSIGFDGSNIYNASTNKFASVDFDYVNNTVKGTLADGYVVNATLSPYVDSKGVAVPCMFNYIDSLATSHATTLTVSASSVALFIRSSDPSLSLQFDSNGNCSANCENGKMAFAFPVKNLALSEIVGKTFHGIRSQATSNPIDSTNKFNYKSGMTRFTYDSSGVTTSSKNCFNDQSIDKAPDCANGTDLGTASILINSDGTFIQRETATNWLYAAGFVYKYRDEIALVVSRRDNNGVNIGMAINYYGASPKNYHLGYVQKFYGNTILFSKNFYQVLTSGASTTDPVNIYEYNGGVLVEGLTTLNTANPAIVGYSNLRYQNYPANGFLFFPGQLRVKTSATIPGTSVGNLIYRSSMTLAARGQWSFNVSSDFGAIYNNIPSSDPNYGSTYSNQYIGANILQRTQ